MIIRCSRNSTESRNFIIPISHANQWKYVEERMNLSTHMEIIDWTNRFELGYVVGVYVYVVCDEKKGWGKRKREKALLSLGKSKMY